MAKRTPRQRTTPHVALIIETSLAYGRGVLRGVARFGREHQPWSVYLEQRSLYDPAPPWLADWKGDGIISRASSPEIARSIAALGIPTVDLNEEVAGLGLPLIYNDHNAIGRLAAEHFLERGFRHFGFIGYDDIAWSGHRHSGFAGAVKERGFDCSGYRWTKPADSRDRLPHWEKEIAAVARWLKQLPKPAGVMACNDFRGVQLIDACRRAGIAVPEEVAVVGVDNEEVACELANPPLTSVVPDAERIGYEAAKLLDQLMQGKEPAQRELAVPPRGMVTRQSTDVTAIEDATVAAAMHFIRKHACDGIGVEDVLDTLTVSRSVLQRRFRATLGRSVHEAILGAKLDRVKRLLVETDLPLPDIAARTGFKHSEYLSVVFKKRVGETASAWRAAQKP